MLLTFALDCPQLVIADRGNPIEQVLTLLDAACRRLSRVVLDPDRGTPGELLIRLLYPDVVVTLARLRRIIEVLKRDLVLLRFELVHILVVLDQVDLGDRSWFR